MKKLLIAFVALAVVALVGHHYITTVSADIFFYMIQVDFLFYI